MRKRGLHRYRPLWDHLDRRCLLSGYSPAQITAAYDLNSISFTTSSGAAVTGNGAGQTIALIDIYHDPEIQASLNGFDAQFGLPNITLDVIDQAGNQTNDGWASEETLDVEWAHAIAPAANIVVVEAAPGSTSALSFNDVLTAIKTASQLSGVSVISMSLGGPEFTGESNDDSAFSTAGITYIASSGDSGTVEWPATSPDVLAVGGTTLTLGGSTGYGHEVGWPFSGGGLSVDESEPSFQQAVQSKNVRSTPDVSFDADPTTGVSIYYVSPTNTSGAGTWYYTGGTSVSAPAWAGIIAIADQGRAAIGLPALTGATQTLPTLYSLPAADFHKVPMDFGVNFGTTNLAINTSVYNTQTGLGSPIGASLITGLVNSGTSSDPPPDSPPPPPPPPAPVIPPPYTIPTPIPLPNPVAPVTILPAPAPTPAPSSPTPSTPAPAAPPQALPKKKTPVSHVPKHHAKTKHPVTQPKSHAKSHVVKKAKARSDEARGGK